MMSALSERGQIQFNRPLYARQIQDLYVIYTSYRDGVELGDKIGCVHQIAYYAPLPCIGARVETEEQN